MRARCPYLAAVLVLCFLPALADRAWALQKPGSVTDREVTCTNGKAAQFDCQNVDLVAVLPPSVLGAQEGLPGFGTTYFLNDLWGWTDAKTGREFALVGRVDGTAFVEVTDPLHPKYLGELPRHAGTRPGVDRDIKVYKDHAFIVADAVGPHGIQIFDLTQLLNAQQPPVMFQETAHYDRVTSARNLTIDTVTGFAYTSNGGQDCVGENGLREGGQIVDLRDPIRPAFAGCSAAYYYMDSQCVHYQGPEQRDRDKDFCFIISSSSVGVHDVTDKQHPKLIFTMAGLEYPGNAHQGWLSDDHRYFFLGNEPAGGVGDSIGPSGYGNRITIFDLTKVPHPEDPHESPTPPLKEFWGTTKASPGNLYSRGRYLYQANHKAGLRVIDIGDPANPKEVGYFDTAPGLPNVSGIAGAWSSYPYFKSGVVAVSSSGEGLFLLRFHPPATPARRGPN